MKYIKLHCVLMDNNEIMLNRKSLGFISDKEIERYVEVYEE